MYLKGTYYARPLAKFLIWHLSWQRTRDWFFGSNLYNCGITWTEDFQSSDKNGIFFRYHKKLKSFRCFKIYQCSNSLIEIYLKLSKNSEMWEELNYLILLMKINAFRYFKNETHNRDSFSLNKRTFLKLLYYLAK